MGISERRIKEKLDLQKLILNAAIEVFLEKGYDGISIRDIADKIEYSPTTIYLYFKDKDAILYAIHLEGFRLMNSKMQVLQYIEDPYERLKIMGKIYLDFAMENSRLYDLMFSQQAPIRELNCEDKDWEAGITSFQALKQTIEECIAHHYFRFKDPEAAAFMIWSTVHGMSALQIGNRCIQVISEEKRGNILQMGYQAFVELLDGLKVK